MSATAAPFSTAPCNLLCDGNDVRLTRALVRLSDAALGLQISAALHQPRASRSRPRLTPRELLARAQDVELQLGRDRAREKRWGPRTADIDILAYDDLTLDEPDLTLPHPRLFERAFVLLPLAEIAGDRMIAGRRVGESWLKQLTQAVFDRLPPPARTGTRFAISQ